MAGKKSTLEEYPSLTRPFIQLGNEALVPELDRFVSGLTDNPNFPNLAEQIAGYAKMVNDYKIAQAKASATMGKNLIIARNKSREKVIVATIAIGNAVVEAANGNVAAIVSTNLPMRKPGQPVTPGAPVGVVLTDSKISGQMDVRLKRPAGNFVIMARYTMAPLSEASVWTTVNSRVAKFSITGLETAKKYYVQLGIMSKGNVTIWGDTIVSPLIS